MVCCSGGHVSAKALEAAVDGISECCQWLNQHSARYFAGMHLVNLEGGRRPSIYRTQLPEEALWEMYASAHL